MLPGVVVHCGSGRIDADGTEVTSESSEGIAHTDGPGSAVIVVLAETQSVCCRLGIGARCDYCEKQYRDSLFHFINFFTQNGKLVNPVLVVIDNYTIHLRKPCDLRSLRMKDF